MEEEIKTTDAELVKVWNDVRLLGEVNDEFSNQTPSEQIEQCPTAAFYRQQAMEHELQTKIPFETWAKVIPPELLSRWAQGKHEQKEKACFGKEKLRETVKNNIVNELYRQLFRETSTDEVDGCKISKS